MLIDRGSYTIYIGGASEAVVRPEQKHLDAPHLWSDFYPMLSAGAHSFYFPKQTHSDVGHIITTAAVPRSFIVQGDYVITHVSGLALGVLTADCVPLVLYDPRVHACAIIHAGWRGVASRIVSRTVDHMRSVYASDPAQLECFIGPCARVCCYSVGTEVQHALARPQAFVFKDGLLFCDLVAAVRSELSELAVADESITVHPACTIDDHRYFSYRRQHENAGRQMTLVCLR